MWQVSITVSPEMEEAAALLLERSCGAPTAVYCDAHTVKRVVSAYPSSLRATRAMVLADLNSATRLLQCENPGAARPMVVVKKLPRENWAESWKRHFKPVEIGDRLLIKPGWSRRRPRRGQRVVVLDPGLSFGTGHHATTEFCLEELAACRRAGTRQSFLDIGAGSGILAIAAAKLGYSPVEAFDCDPVAVRVSVENAKRNHVENRVRPRREDLTRLPVRGRRKWDVICANLTAELLRSEARKIRARLHPGGRLIVAGVMESEFQKICKDFAICHLTLAKSEVKERWQSGRFVLAPKVQEQAGRRGEKDGGRYFGQDESSLGC
ncbi:MAG: 50S ribosomal protein L11 methyltransferase [Verrucomicrobiota bacterium]|jgi:ribosomal protein L11 methyltransferase